MPGKSGINTDRFLIFAQIYSKHMENTPQSLDYYLEYVKNYAPKVLLAIVVLIVGLWLVRRITQIVEKGLQRSGVDIDLRPFFSSIANLMMKVLLFLIVANMVGIETTSFVAILASLAFAVGLALQGSLGNFAAGVVILLFKPYKVGDLVEVAEKRGYVTEIQVFNTILKSPDNRSVIIPNGIAIGGVIINFSGFEKKCVDILVPLPYAVVYDQAAPHILSAVSQTKNILTSPAPTIEIDKFDTLGYYVSAKVYTVANFYEVQGEALLLIKTALDRQGIRMGLPEDGGYG